MSQGSCKDPQGDGLASRDSASRKLFRLSSAHRHLLSAWMAVDDSKWNTYNTDEAQGIGSG
ncbi:unnamed protein product [Nesidiocoris tenuis]|uniref:Uncharacterized protein n=1 Tax=Nesidiocoris tenuis TaxID=355587 RepID=A0A6H5H0X9_9HEMI|nr:unnamed protein product [Nesidiocoris tenuis]